MSELWAPSRGLTSKTKVKSTEDGSDWHHRPLHTFLPMCTCTHTHVNTHNTKHEKKPIPRREMHLGVCISLLCLPLTSCVSGIMACVEGPPLLTDTCSMFWMQKTVFLPAFLQKSILKAQFLLFVCTVNSYWKIQPYTRHYFLPCKCFRRVHCEDEAVTPWHFGWQIFLSWMLLKILGALFPCLISHSPQGLPVLSPSSACLGLSLFDFLMPLCVMTDSLSVEW